MEVLATIEAGGHTIDFGVANTRREREAVLAQRFRVFQRQGYFRKELRVDQDEYDGEAVYFLGRLRSEPDSISRSSGVSSMPISTARLNL